MLRYERGVRGERGDRGLHLVVVESDDRLALDVGREDEPHRDEVARVHHRVDAALHHRVGHEGRVNGRTSLSERAAKGRWEPRGRVHIRREAAAPCPPARGSTCRGCATRRRVEDNPSHHNLLVAY